jgi:hypothetical protein
MTAAVAAYLSYRRDEVDQPPEELLRRAAAAEYDGSPPPEIQQWLSGRV